VSAASDASESVGAGAAEVAEAPAGSVHPGDSVRELRLPHKPGIASHSGIKVPGNGAVIYFSLDPQGNVLPIPDAEYPASAL
jgi:hypothetical protein